MFRSRTKASTARLKSRVICPSNAGKTIAFLRSLKKYPINPPAVCNLGNIAVEVNAVQTMKRRLHMLVRPEPLERELDVVLTTVAIASFRLASVMCR